jgi:hypothetical protein
MRSFHHRSLGGAASVLGLALAGLAGLAGCAGYGPPPGVVGQPLATVEQAMGPATGRYTLPDGRERIEFARGPFGRHTWMLATIRDGDSMASVLQRIGRPGDKRSGGWQRGEVWNWRYDTNDCLWFELSVVDGVVRSPAIVLDPRCDTRTDAARE